jgi:hypothetical protein
LLNAQEEQESSSEQVSEEDEALEPEAADNVICIDTRSLHEQL